MRCAVTAVVAFSGDIVGVGENTLAGEERGTAVCYHVIMLGVPHRPLTAATSSSIVRACISQLLSVQQ